MDSHAYCRRLGLDGPPGERSRAAVATLQAAHVRRVPFETLAVAGDPFEDRAGRGVTLDRRALYEKLVARERGGYCYELNGLFGWLLEELGYDVEHVAARMLQDDGTAGHPANHLANVLTLDGERYLVDVGLGTPTLRRPLPLDGRVVTDDAGVAWTVAESDRPDADGLTRYRCPNTWEWTDRYLFATTPRDLGYFAATNDHLSTAPESPFTGSPVVARATDRGHVKLTGSRFTEWVDGVPTEQSVPDAETWYDRLRSTFGIGWP